MAVFATIVLVMTGGLAFALPVAFVLGAGLVVMGVGMQLTLQTRVPEEYRGRVLSLYGICFMGGPAIGSLIMGAIAEHVGLRLPIIAGSVVVALGWHGVWRKRHGLERTLDALKPTA